MIITLTENPHRVIRLEERLEALVQSLDFKKSHKEQEGVHIELALLNRLTETGQVDVEVCRAGLELTMGAVNILVLNNRRDHVITMNGGTE
jgi:hypothetical protein